MASSKTKSNVHKSFQRSSSPSGRFCSSTMSSSSSVFASSISSFSPPTRSFSPNQINVHSSSPSVRFSIDHGNASIASSSRESSQSGNHSCNHSGSNKAWSNGQKKACMCSPTTHPGSFRCRLHRNVSARSGSQSTGAVSYPSHRLNARRSAMTNSLVRIGTVEGDLVKRALASLIRPSSHQQRRRGDFQPKPSRLSVMSNAGD